MVVSLLAGVLLGLSLAAPPGPMNAVIANESVNGGWRSGVAAGLGAMTADACFFVLALLGVVTFVRELPVVRGVMVGIGGLLMLYFAYGAYLDAQTALSERSAPGAGFRKAFALAITNPYQVVWWLTAGVALLDPGSVEVAGYTLATGNGTLTVVGFFAGIFLWITGFPSVLVTTGRRVDSLAKAVGYGSAVLLAGFGVLFCYQSVDALLKTL